MSAVIDFNYIEALNTFVDHKYLTKTINNIKGGTKGQHENVVLKRINGTQFLVNVYKTDNNSRYYIDSLMLIPNEFNIKGATNMMDNLSINETSGGKGRPKKNSTPKKSTKKSEKSDKPEKTEKVQKSGKNGMTKPDKKKGRPKVYANGEILNNLNMSEDEIIYDNSFSIDDEGGAKKQ